MSKKRGEAVPARVLMLLTNEYRPDPRVRKEALALLQGGYSVNIICWNRRGGRPSAETAEGVKLDRVRTGVVDGPLGVILNYPLFAVKVFRRANGNGYDAVHAHDLDTLPIGVLLAWLKRVPLVFDAHEQYGRMIRTDLPNWIARLFERMEGKLLSKVDLGITVNGRIADTMRSSVKGVMLVVMNAVDVPDFAARNANREDGQIVLYYGGTLEPMRYIEEMIDVAAGAEGIKVVFAGNGRLESFVEEAAKKHGNIEFHGFLPHGVMLKEMSEADVVLCLIDPSNLNYVDSLPNKVCEAMAVGMPVLTSKGTFAGETVERLGIGVAIEWSRREFLEALDRLRHEEFRQRMGANGRKLAEERYNWKRMEQRLLDAYARLPWKRIE